MAKTSRKPNKKKNAKIAIYAATAIAAAAALFFGIRAIRDKIRLDAAKEQAYKFAFKASFEASMLHSCIEASRGQADYCNCYTNRFVAMLDEHDWESFMGAKKPEQTMKLIEKDPAISGKIKAVMGECIDRVRLPKGSRGTRAAMRAPKQAARKSAATAATLKGTSLPAK
jgi:hypothetical protein